MLRTVLINLSCLIVSLSLAVLICWRWSKRIEQGPREQKLRGLKLK